MDYLPMNPEPSHKMWYIGGAVLVIVLAAFGSWYVMQQPQALPAPTATTVVENKVPVVADEVQQAQTVLGTTGTSVADITADLNQTADSAAALQAEKAASAKAVSGF